MRETFNQIVGRNTLALRNERGLSTDHAWKLLRQYGFSKATMNRVELARNSTDPDATPIEESKIKAIAEFHNVTPESIMETDETVNGLIVQIEAAFRSSKKDKYVLQLLDKLLSHLFVVGVDRQLIRKNGAPRIRVRALLLRGKFEFLKGNHSESIEWSTHAMELATAAKDYEMVHRCRYNIASSFLETGESSKVIHVVGEDNRDTTFVSDIKFSKNMFLLGNAYIKLNDWNLAVWHIREAISKSTDKVDLARSYQLLAKAHKRNKSYQDAIEAAILAIQYANDAGDKIGEIYALVAKGEIMLETGEGSQAAELFLNANLIAISIGFRMETLFTRFLFLLAGQHEIGILEELAEIVSEFETLSPPPSYLVTLYINIGKVAKEFENSKLAVEYYEKAMSLMVI